MPDTYDRIRHVLTRLAEEDSWNTTELAEAIEEEAPAEFQFRRGEDEYCMSAESIRRILRLTVDLDLSERIANARNAIKLTDRGAKCLRSERQCALQIRACVTAFLEDNYVGVEQIRESISAIQLPAVPDAKTIFLDLSRNPRMTLTEKTFRTMMYLLWRTGGAERAVKVLYGFKS